MTNLRGTSLEDYEFFTPATAEFADHLDNPENAGIPGRDAFPRGNRDGAPSLLEDEQILERLVCRKLHRGLMLPAGTPENWAVSDGEWLREEVASMGGVAVVVTSRRLAVAIPQTRSNQQTHEVVIRPVRLRGQGPAVKPNVKDRLLLGAFRSAAGMGGAVGGFARDMIGDLPAIAGHLALETISSVRWPAAGMRGPVVVATAIGYRQPSSRLAGAGRHRKLMVLELDAGPAAEALGQVLASAVRSRLMACTPTEAHAAIDGMGVTEDGHQLVYEPPLSRPIGAREALTTEAARAASSSLPEEIALLEEPLPSFAEDTSRPPARDEPTADAVAPIVRYCDQCGTRTGPEDAFCGNCGVRLDAIEGG